MWSRRGKFSLRHHPHLDDTCEIDSEEISPSNFFAQLETDIETLPLSQLQLHYPELEFTRIKGAAKKGTHDYMVKKGKFTTFADWRKH